MTGRPSILMQEMDVVPIAIGPRHFSVAGATPALPEDLRAGDRLRWEVPPEWALTVKKAQPSKTAPLSPVAESMVSDAPLFLMKTFCPLPLAHFLWGRLLSSLDHLYLPCLGATAVSVLSASIRC